MTTAPPPAAGGGAPAAARRRARLAARGEWTDEDEPQPIAEAPTRQGGGFLGRIFPPAPPLPGRGDPLAARRQSHRVVGGIGGIVRLGRASGR